MERKQAKRGPGVPHQGLRDLARGILANLPAKPEVAQFAKLSRMLTLGTLYLSGGVQRGWFGKSTGGTRKGRQSSEGLSNPKVVLLVGAKRTS
jgi:hypothetical protein